jgi:NAD+ synthase
LWYAQENHVSPEETAVSLGMTPAQVQNAFDDFTRKTRSTHYLRTPPLDMASLGNPVPAGH